MASATKAIPFVVPAQPSPNFETISQNELTLPELRLERPLERPKKLGAANRVIGALPAEGEES